MVRELTIWTQDGQTRTVQLKGDRLYLGRSASAEICFPDDAGLSRQHLVFEREGGDWTVQDLGSKNGTLVNSIPLKAKLPLRPGDKINAGHLLITYGAPSQAAPESPVIFVDSADTEPPGSSTYVTNLESALSSQTQISERGLKRSRHVRALIRAGTELSRNQPLEELFRLILDLSIEAVGARRGVLMALEGDELMVRANQGENFRISSAVRDRVLRDGRSVLVKDAQSDDAFRGRLSIVQQRVRSMMSAPLQTRERIIGLIYVDSPSLLDEFTEDDLSLLTVMANVAAVRIEHSRLAEVEQVERMMARELEQAAEIQRQLLPVEPPRVSGVDLAGYNAPCRTVGGDYFDFFPYPNGRVAMALGDVSGKGMPASLLMVGLQARVQVLTHELAGLGSVMTRLNRITCAHCPQNRFITLFLCLLDPHSGELAYANAGHNPPIFLGVNGDVNYLEGGGPVLGVVPDAAYAEQSRHLEIGDTLALYSDGVTEAMNAAGEEFGEDRLIDTLRQHRGVPAAEILAAVNRALETWVAGATSADDVTLVIAKRVPVI